MAVGDKAHIMINRHNQESVEKFLEEVELQDKTKVLFENVDV